MYYSFQRWLCLVDFEHVDMRSDVTNGAVSTVDVQFSVGGFLSKATLSIWGAVVILIYVA